MENNSRLRINLTTREMEIEGSEQFIEKYAKRIESCFESFATSNSPLKNAIKNPMNGQSGQNPFKGNLPDTFGEYYHLLPRNVTDVDRMLIAGYFAQSKSEENSFETKDASTLLVDQGVRLSNASRSLRGNLPPKYLITLSKGKFRVSPSGLEKVNELVSGEPV